MNRILINSLLFSIFILSVGGSIIGINNMNVHASSSDPNKVNVTVPSNLNIVLNEDGSNSTSDYKVNNNSLVPIIIDNVNVVEKNGWSLVKSDEEILKDEKKISISINDIELSSGNNSLKFSVPESSIYDLHTSFKRGAFTIPVSEEAFEFSFNYLVGKKDFTLEFDSNGGSSVSSMTAKNGEKLTLPSTKYGGYNLVGWKDSNGVVYNVGESFTMPIGGETLTAVWEPITFCIVYEGNGATSGSMSMTTSVTFGVNTKIETNQFTKTGYKFSGWSAKRSSDNKTRYKSPDGSSGDWYLEGSQPEGWIPFLYPDNTVVAKTTGVDGDVITLSAQWEANTYTMRFDGNGATSGSMEDQLMTYGVRDVINLNQFNRTGYTFLYWNTKKTVNGTTYWLYIDPVTRGTAWYQYGTQPSGWELHTYSDGQISISPTNVDGDVLTLVAQWVANTFTVVYEGDGATSGSMGNTVVTFGVETTLTPNSYVKTGYTFSGWLAKRQSDSKIRYKSADGSSSGWYTEANKPDGWVPFLYPNGGRVGMTSAVDKDIVTMTAQWKINTLTITYRMNGGTLGESHGSNITSDGDYILVNGSLAGRVLNYGTSLNASGLPDWDNPKSINVVKNGYKAKEGAEWTTNPDGNGKEFSDSVVYSVSDFADLSDGSKTVVLYVNWEPITYSIKYDGNGATSGTMNMTTEVTYGVGKPMELNQFKKTGYTFAGWSIKRSSDNKTRYTLSDGTTDWFVEGTQPSDATYYLYKDGQESIWSTLVDGDVLTASAQWQINVLTIRYHMNGGYLADPHGPSYSYSGNYVTSSGSTNVQRVKYGESLPFSGLIDYNSETYVNIKKTGYKVDLQSVWNTKPDGSGTSFNQTTVYSVNDLADISESSKVLVLYVNWIPYNINIKFDSNGGSGSMDSLSVPYGLSFNLPSNKFTKTGYKLKGWIAKRDSADAYRYISEDGKSSGWYKQGEQPDGWTMIVYSDEGSYYPSSIVDNDNFTLVAQWEPITYTVRFDGNGATSGSMSDVVVTYGTFKSMPSYNFAKVGYRFKNWEVYRVENGINLYRYKNHSTGVYGWYKDDASAPSGFKKYYWTNTEATGTATTIDGDIIYAKAVWDPITFNIVYDGNGATSGSMDMSTTITYDVYTALEKNQFTKTGYTFLGWKAKRKSDSKVRYINPSNSSQSGWYLEGSQPSGWLLYLHEDGRMVGTTSTVNGDTVTMTAQWEINTLSIMFHMNGGYLDDSHGSSLSTDGEYILSGDSVLVRTYNYGTTMPSGGLPDWNNANFINVKKTGYTVASGKEWNTKPDGTGLSLDDAISYAISDISDVSTESKTITLYVNWKPVTSTVTVNANGGTSTSSNLIGSVGEVFDISNLVTKSGYSLSSWTGTSDGYVGYSKISMQPSKSTLSPYCYGYYKGEGSVANFSILSDVTKSSDNPSTYSTELKITVNNPYSVGAGGGFSKPTLSKSGGKFIHTFTAKIPKGLKVIERHNSVCDNGKVTWLTQQYGTGEWETYAYLIECGISGTFNAFGYVELAKSYDSSISYPFDWYVAINDIIDVSDDVTSFNRFVMGYSGGELKANWEVSTLSELNIINEESIVEESLVEEPIQETDNSPSTIDTPIIKEEQPLAEEPSNNNVNPVVGEPPSNDNQLLDSLMMDEQVVIDGEITISEIVETNVDSSQEVYNELFIKEDNKDVSYYVDTNSDDVSDLLEDNRN